jgi:agmatine deiminase
VDCEYNAWGGKYPPWDLDAQVAAHMAELLGVPRFAGDFVLEGGSVDVNGAGALLTTEQCLLNPNRNPSLDQAEIEQRLRRLLGVEQIIWLGDGIVGDDTDGHVDDLCRFVGPRTVVTVTESDPADDNYRALAENLERLRAVRLADGQGLEIIELPMPAPLSIGGQRVPASYANFYIANRAVLLPVFDDPQDEIAARRLQACFPDRRVVPIDCRDLVWGLGAIHCLTQQVPATAIAGAHNVL